MISLVGNEKQTGTNASIPDEASKEPDCRLITKRIFDALREEAVNVGNKAANLGILGKVSETDPFFAVPLHQAVRHQTVSAFIEMHTQGMFQKKWNAFRDEVDSMGFSERARSILEEIQSLVLSTFQQEGAKIPDIQEFLGKIPRECRLIIRSTGREDAKNLANAGGNKTCINIPPLAEEIAKAMGEVVASYFSVRSMGQRLQAGDAITEEPLMPVLLQMMIEGSASGVIFADESTGRTPGVSCIEGAWGHNELVVGGLGPVDRYFVGPNHRIHKTIAYKVNRLVSRTDGNGLSNAANPLELRSAPALETNTLLRLHDFYQQLKPLYGGNVDGEFTKTELVNLLQVRPLPQGRELNPTYFDAAILQPVAEASPMVPADCRVRVLEAIEEVHFGVTVGEARRTFLEEIPKAVREKVKVIFVSTPGGSNSHEATEFRANNLPVLCLSKQEVKAFEAALDSKEMLLLVDVVEGKIGKVPRPDFKNTTSLEETLINDRVILAGWLKHPLPAVQSISGEGLNENELNAFLSGIVEACIKLELLSEDQPSHAGARLESLISLLNSGKLEPCSFREIMNRIGSKDILQRLSAVVTILKVAYSLCVRYKKTPLEERALGVSRQLIADAKDVWDHSDSSQIQRLYAHNWLRATLTQQPPAGLVGADSPYTLLALKKELDAAKALLHGDDWRIEMLAVMLRLGNYSLNAEVQSDWRTFCSALCAEGDKEKIDRLARVLYRIGTVGAEVYWLHALFLPAWRQSKDPQRCLNKLIIETARSIDALDAAGALQVGLKNLDELPHLYNKQNSFGKSLLLKTVGEVVERLDRKIKEMLVQAGNDEQKLQKFQEMLRPYVWLMHVWLKLVDGKDVPGHDSVQQINQQIGEISGKLLDPAFLKSPNIGDQLNISSRFNVSAAQIGSGTNFSRHQPKTLSDLFTLAHQNILFALAYLQNKENVFGEHLPKTVRSVVDALASAEMLNFRIEDDEQRFVSSRPALISMSVDFPHLIIRFNAPQRNHSALFEISAALDCKSRGVKDLKVGGKLFGYQAHDMPRMPWAAAYAELCARAGGFEFSPEGKPSYDRSRDMVEFTWTVGVSQAEKFAQFLPDYLNLITTSLYTGSRSRQIPIPGGKRNLCFTDNWGMPKLDPLDNSTTLKEYYARDDVDLAASSTLRLQEAIENIMRIHPEWNGGGLKFTDLEPIVKWHQLVGRPC